MYIYSPYRNFNCSVLQVPDSKGILVTASSGQLRSMCMEYNKCIPMQPYMYIIYIYIYCIFIKPYFYVKLHENLYQYYESHENPKYSPLYPVSIATCGYFLPYNHDNDRMLCRFCFIYKYITTGSLQCKVPCMHTRQHNNITDQSGWRM